MKSICTKIVLFSLFPILLILSTAGDIADIVYGGDETSSDEIRYYKTSPAQPVAHEPIDPFPSLYRAPTSTADTAVEEQAAKEKGFTLCHCIFKWLRRDN